MALTDNIVAYWKLDESSGDAADSVNSNTGVNTSVTYGAGKLNNGAIFNGSAYFTVTDNATLEPTSDISFGGWVNITSTASYQMMFAKGENAGDTRSYEMRCYSTTTQIEIQMRVNGGSYTQARSTIAIGTGVWAHVIFTRTGTTQKIYINGVADVLATDTTGAGNIDYSTDDLWIGQRNGAYRFNGKLDEIGIWSRTLTAHEVSQLYNGNLGSQYTFTSVGIARGGAVSGGEVTATSLTYAVTVPGSNTFGYVSILGKVSATSVITGVTWNGSAMTYRTGQQLSPGDRFYECWYIVGPTTGNIVISASESNYIASQATFYSGASQGALDATNTNFQTTGTPNTNTLTTVATNSWHIMGVGTASGTPTAGTGSYAPLAATGNSLILDGNIAITPAGSNSIGATGMNTLFGSGTIGISIAPYSSSSSTVSISPQLLTLGVG